MNYLCLIYDDEKQWASFPQQDRDAAINEYWAFEDSIKKSGHFLASKALQPTSTATSVRVRDGKLLITDGPFAETREQLGGYYLIDAKDLDEAIAIAARIPSAGSGTIEVRPIMVFDPPPG